MDRWTERLSEYLDDELELDDRRALEAHLDTCPDCVEILAGLGRVVERARSLEPRPPDADLWPAVAARIGARTWPWHVLTEARKPREARGGWGYTFSLPQLMAAGFLLVALSGGVVWMVRDRVERPVAPTASVKAEIPESYSAGYEAAVAELERVLDERRQELDPSTVRVLERNPAIIEDARREALLALAADSTNTYLREHLGRMMQRKVDLLREATVLASSEGR